MRPDKAVLNLRRRTRRPSLEVVIVLVASVLDVALVLVATGAGPGLTPDSATYISSGVDLVQHGRLIDFQGVPLTLFPPGLPLLVAAGVGVGLKAFTVIRLVNAASALLMCVLGWAIARFIVESPFIRAVVVVAACVAVPLLYVNRMAWSESPFIALCLASLALLVGTGTDRLRGLRVSPWLIAGFLAGASMGVRYAGLGLIVTGGVWALWPMRQGRRLPISERVRTLIQFGVGAALIPAAVVVRNLIVDGSLLGPRTPSPDTVPAILDRFLATVGLWAVTYTPAFLRNPVGVIALSIVLLGVATAAWRARRTAKHSGDVEPEGARDTGSVIPLAIFAVVYSVNIVYASATTLLDPLSDRLLSPLFLPVVLLVATGCDRLRVPTREWSVVKISAAVLTVIALSSSAEAAARMGADSYRTGVAYGSRWWRTSGVQQRLERLPPDASLYTNAPYSAAMLVQGRRVKQTPLRHAYRSTESVPVPSSFVADVNCSKSYLAWFKAKSPVAVYSPDELRPYVQVTLIDRGHRWRLFALTPRTEQPQECAG